MIPNKKALIIAVMQHSATAAVRRVELSCARAASRMILTRLNPLPRVRSSSAQCSNLPPVSVCPHLGLTSHHQTKILHPVKLWTADTGLVTSPSPVIYGGGQLLSSKCEIIPANIVNCE